MRVKYIGSGDEFFPDLHWQPQPGDVREVPDEFPIDPARLEVVDQPDNQDSTTLAAAPAEEDA